MRRANDVAVFLAAVGSSCSAPTPAGPAPVIVVSPPAATATVGGTVAFKAQFQSGRATSAGTTFTWSSANRAVATIAASGLATAVAPGVTQITAAAAGDTSRPAILVVAARPAPTIAAIIISPVADTIPLNDIALFTAIAFDAAGQPMSGVAFTWHESDPSVAIVSSLPPYTLASAIGLGAGTTGITAAAQNLVSAPAQLTVVDAPPEWTGTSSTTIDDANPSYAVNAVVTWKLDTLFSSGGKIVY